MRLPPIKIFFIFTLLLIPLAHSQAQEITVSAHFEPATIRQGEVSRWVVTIENANTNLPIDANQLSRPGLEYIGSAGTQSSTQFSRGEIIITKQFSFAFRATEAQEFIFPAIPITINNRGFQIPQSSLKVLPPSASTKEKSEKIALEIELPQNKIYVGQTFPISIKALSPRDAEVGFRQQPEVQAEGFTAPRFGDRLSRNTLVFDGEIMESNQMSTYITALQQGSHPISAQWEMLLTLDDGTPPSHQGLFGSFFNRRQISKILEKQLDDVVVHPLPTADQPPSFTGAIGMFSIKSTVQPQETKVGEPITLTVILVGEGNFDRISAPELKLNENWKSYPPKTTFVDQPAEEHLTGYTGEKTFEYILIPQSEAITEVPSVTFSFFSPEDESYITSELPPLPLRVHARPQTEVASTHTAIETLARPTAPEAQLSTNNALRPIISQTTPSVNTLQPILKNPLFLLANAILLALIVLLTLLRYLRYRQSNNPQALARKASRQRLRTYQKEMPLAIDQEQWSRFLELCRLALAEIYFGHSERDPRSLTSGELILEIKQDKRLSQTLQEQGQACLQAEETHKYGGTITSSHKCKSWMNDVETIRKTIAS